MTRWTFKAEDIFGEIPENPENVNMTIPPEVAEAVGLEPGDPIKIMVGDQGTIIIEKLGEEENSDVEE